MGDFNGDGWDDLTGLTPNGQIYYTLNRSTWTLIPGQFVYLLAGLAGIDAAHGRWYKLDVTTPMTGFKPMSGKLHRLLAFDRNG